MKATNLKKLIIEGKEPIIAPGAYDAVSARIIESAGFNAVYMTGYGVSASFIGRPDLGLITLKEMATQAENIANSINIPLIADADNGYGNELNMARTVELYERAGVSGIQVEDQVFPKKCGHMANKAVIPFQEAVQKVRAAVRARTNPDVQIIARTDSREVMGFDEAINRCLAFADEGADIIFFEAPETEEEIKIVSEKLKGISLLANMVEGGKTPLMNADELYNLGYKVIIYPITALLSGVNAMRNALRNLNEKGISTPSQTIATWPELNIIMGADDYNQLADKLISERN